MLNKFLITVAMILMSGFSVAEASPAAFLNMGGGARPIAMGGAFTAVSGDPFCSSWNPAGAATLKNFHTSAMFHGPAPDKWTGMEDVNSGYNYFNILAPFHKLGLSRRGTVSLSLFSMGIEEIPITTTDGAGSIVKTGTFDNKETAVVLSAAYPFFAENLLIGGNIKYITQNFDGISGASARGWDTDIGIIVSFSQAVNIGFNFNAGPTLKWDSGHKDRGGMKSKIGASYQKNLSKSIAFLSTLDLIQKEDMPLKSSIGSEVSAETGLGNINKISVRGGLKEITLEDRYSYRSNLNRVLTWNAGMGVDFDILLNMALDYSFSSDSLGPLHRISMNLMF